jgi:Protein of unknown function (DUF2510).
MPDDASPPAWVPVEPAVATPPGWYPDGRGNRRWWDGSEWTDDVTGLQPAVSQAMSVFPAGMPVQGGRSGWWIAGGIAVAVLLVAGAFGVAALGPGSAGLTHGRAAALSAGTADFYTFTGPLARPMAVGAPWGRACEPVVLNVEDSVPDAVYAEIVRVVAEARAGGIDIGVESRQHTWRPSELYPDGLQNTDVEFVPVFSDTDGGHLRSDGKPERDLVGWDAAPDPNGLSEHLTTLRVTLHLATLGDSPLEYRRAMRKFVGWSQGIADSTSPNSALPLRATAAPDAFSPADIAAMKVMSGCAGR